MAKKKKAYPSAGRTIDSAKRYKKDFFWGPFFKMFEAIFELITPVMMSLIVSKGLIYNDAGVVTGANWNLVIGLIGAMLAMTLLGFGSTMICQYKAARASQGTGTDLRNRLFAHVQRLPASQMEEFGIGNIINVITNDTNQVQQGVAMLIRLAIRAPFLVIGAIVASLIIDWKSGLVFIGLAIVLFAFLLLVLPKTSKGYVKVQEKLDVLSQKTDDSLSGARVVRAFNKEEFELDKFSKASGEYVDESLKISKITSLMGPVTTFAINVVILILVIIGSMSGIFNPNATAEIIASENGKIVALVNYLNQILQAIVVVTNLIIIFTKSYASMKRCDKLLAIEPNLVNDPKVQPFDIEIGQPLYEFKNAALNYPGSDVPAIDNLNITIHKGDRIGIIGGTGSGKSSILNLLLRFYDPSKGEIDYKGHPLKDYDLHALYKEIGYVPQKPQVYRGTIRSNLLLSNPNATEDDMKDALNNALCDYVFKDEKGLDRPIEEGAKDLSGGQRQRLAIAMALVKKPSVIFLDDSYSALDFLSERKLRDNLLALGKDLTQVVISERVSSLMGCDLIMVLDKGQVESIGKPDELYGKSKVFTEIVDVQKGLAR